jgi:hypothetical protein
MIRDGKLEVLDNIPNNSGRSGQVLVFGGNMVSGSTLTGSGFGFANTVAVPVDSRKSPELLTGPRPWYKKFAKWFTGAEEKQMTVQQFFSSVKDSVKQAEMVSEKAKGYELAIEKAKECGQTALLEKLEAGLLAARAEAQLTAVGYTKYITEETLVSFVKQCEKGLRLDHIKNFTRPLPPFVAKRKKEATDRAIFDNFVVLHYDPDAKSFADTKEEIEKKKDPILFGLVRGSRKLYFIADWIDELCDLTLEDIAEKIGKESIQDIRKDNND